MQATLDSSLVDHAAIRSAFVQARANGLRAKDAADAIGLSEGAVVAAHVGPHEQPLKAQSLRPEWFEILLALEPCGTLMALTRNASVVHEKEGVYKGFSREGQIALCNNEDIDLRIFFFQWHAGFAVTEPGHGGAVMRSLQFFNQQGVAVHKIYAREATHLQALDAVVARFADAQMDYQFVPAPAPAAIAADSSIDAKGLHQAWAAMQDTHEFFGMLKQFDCERQQGFRLTQGLYSDALHLNAVTPLLERAAATQLPIMVFVGSKGCIQIHSGPLKQIKPMQTADGADWINVLDPGFNLHLRRDLITSAWLVRKPTVDGVVTSVELFDASGDLVAMFFGVRHPGEPELAAWRDLAENLPRA